MSTITEELYDLSSATLKALAKSLREGSLSFNITRNVVNNLTGCEGNSIFDCLVNLSTDGMAPQHLAIMLDALAETKDRSPNPSILFELVLSGPDISGVPMENTAAAFQMLINEACHEVLLVGYAVYGGEQIFKPLALKMEENPGLKVVFCLDISRKYGDTSLDSEIVKRFSQDFREKHWPWPKLPELYYDPRALSVSGERASLHAKCVVIDRKATLITSANFTEAAQERNIELGLLVRFSPIAKRVADYFYGLRESKTLRKCLL